MSGCSAKYNYCTLNTTTYAADYPTDEPPQAEQFNLTKQSLADPTVLPPFMQLQDNVIYINNNQLTNFVISDLTGYAICFFADAIVTVSGNFRNADGACIISTANLTLILKGNLYSGNKPQKYVANNIGQNYLGCVKANNITLQTEGGAIYSGAGPCLQAETITLDKGNMLLNSPQSSIDCKNLNIYGGNISLSAQTALNSQNIAFYGGKTTINAQKCAINCIFLRIFNGVLTITSKDKAVCCKTLQKSAGFIKITAKIGIQCQDATITEGLMFANCNQISLQATKQLNISGGTNLLVASGLHSAALEADGIPFNITGGITIQNSAFATKPTNGRYYGFNITSGQALYIQCKSANYAYIANTSGSICISGNIKPTSYSTSGRLIGYKDCFFGLLINPKINAYSLHNIPNATTANFGAQWCNLGTVNNSLGQIF